MRCRRRRNKVIGPSPEKIDHYSNQERDEAGETACGVLYGGCLLLYRGGARGNQDRHACSIRDDLKRLRGLREEVVNEDRRRHEGGREP